MPKTSILFVILLLIFPLSFVNSAQLDPTYTLTAKEQRKIAKWEKKIDKWQKKQEAKEGTKSNKLPMASLGLGVLGLLTFFLSGALGLLIGLGAFVTGAIVFLNSTDYNKNGRLMGLLGLLMGIGFLLIAVLVLLLFVGVGFEGFEGIYERVLG